MQAILHAVGPRLRRGVGIVERVPYSALVDRLARKAQALSGRMTQVEEADGYPLYHIELPGPKGAPRLVISAGIHGEEPGSAMGFLYWLENHAEEWAGVYSFDIFPCLNPWGYERGIRFNADGRDLNRTFKETDPPPCVRLVRQVTAGQHYAMAVDMHEDCDFFGFYVYERGWKDSAFANRLVDAISKVGPLSDGEEGDEPEVHGGIVTFNMDGRTLVEIAEERDLWPIAFHYYHCSDHMMTAETPGRQPLEVRVSMQQVAVQEALQFTRERLGI